MNWRQHLREIVITGGAALAMVAGCDGTNQPQCRKIDTAYDVVINDSIGPRTVPTNCSFDRGQVAYRCSPQVVAPDNTGTTSENVSVTTITWHSLQDFLSAGLPVGLFKQSTSTRTEHIAGLDTPCVLTSTYVYNDQGRPSAVTGSGSAECTASSTEQIRAGSETFDTWDTFGRPTHGRSGIGTAGCQFSRTIDDATNTIVTTFPAGPGCVEANKTAHYDFDGIVVDSSETFGIQTSTMTYTNQVTTEICN